MEQQKLTIPYPVIVEGKYDRLRLECVIRAQILSTDGFGVFNHTEKDRLFRALAQKTPLIVLTDSDGAGKLIRSHLTSLLPPDRLIHLYVPKIPGKEKRKSTPSAEGILGVEGMNTELLYKLFAPFATPDAQKQRTAPPISKADLYADGLTGREDSRKRRDLCAEQLGLPPGMTPNAFLAALNVLCSREEYAALLRRNADA